MMKTSKSGNVRKLKAHICKHDNQRGTSCKLYIKNVFTHLCSSVFRQTFQEEGDNHLKINFSFKSNPINIELIIAQNFKCTGSPQ